MDELDLEHGLILDVKEILRSSSLEGVLILKLTNFNRGGLLEDYKDNISPDLQHQEGKEVALPTPLAPPLETKKARQKKTIGL